MITKTKQVYYCDHCKKYYLRKDSCVKHELICHKNPDNNRDCWGCNHLAKEETSIYHDTYIGEQEQKVQLFKCRKLEKWVYPPKVEMKNNWFDLGDEFNEPMPKECPDREEPKTLSEIARSITLA